MPNRMSQGDYLKHKISSHVLKEQAQLPSILGSKQYSEYKRYQLANNIPNTKNTYSMLLPSTKQNIYGMEKSVSGCAEFKLCEDTQSRPNRVPHTLGTNPDGSVRCFLKPEYVKQPSNAKTACDCALYRTTSNPCGCATSH